MTLNAKERRDMILKDLQASQVPITANQFASKYEVSRQIIVGDIAILRATHHDILATNQGYLLNLPVPEHQTARYSGKIVCQHQPDQAEEELLLIVNHGGRVEDVQIDHPIYGNLKASLRIASQDDVDQFISSMQEFQGEMLSSLTNGIHIHTITTPDLKTFNRIEEGLSQAGILFR